MSVRQVVVAVSAERVRAPLSLARIEAAARTVLRAERVTEALLSVTLVSERRIAALNARHMRHRGATDVISLAFRREKGQAVIGDMYIAPAVARANARAAGVGVQEELVRLVVHGVLHVLGHDHPEHGAREQSPMWRRQEALVGRVMRGSAP